MYSVASVEDLRKVEQNGNPCMQAIIKLEGQEHPYAVLFQKSSEGAYEVLNLYRNEADYKVDWYDNSLHQAYVNVADQKQHLFQNREEENQFVEQILNFQNKG
ncbi:hypothetical protein [Chengkuizengella axinellae]|uniref:DUF1292 domain-containing protein n=1 Tax=Chengkuizengella axinellae TaxID=3064388 RepID=A0ABT9ITL5_9BACL|nr:hypothetical protein [Chengkuizengella sp. 2205SS18-9]MDP5272652.1 hypothetical protein [Chengkuizengella sp. 2205SS18-9]